MRCPRGQPLAMMPTNLSALQRMLELVGDSSLVTPSHDPEQFRRFPRVTEGVMLIKDHR